ncbi:GntR family transcriptional regulator [Streptosporangium sp. NPDC006007]|uniref:GntR family transcriptional regulator n=1 Tax=Streptosporangium sp. NPDC006007 TaxID=3154575 RepID=UPI0033ABF731
MIARYRELASDLRRAIEDDTYPPGAVLPKITELAKKYGMANETVRLAIGVLESEGLVRAIRKRGTVVLDRTPVRVRFSRYRAVLTPNGDRGPWETACREQGVNGEMQTVEVEREPAPPEVASALHLAAGTAVLRRSRRALIDGEPAQLQTAWYPYELIRGTPIARSSKVVGGIYRALLQAGLTPASAGEEIRSRPPVADEAAELRLRGGGWILEVRRTTFDAAKTPIEYQVIVADPARTIIVYDDLPLQQETPPAGG